jgi:hypothetical protein
MRERETDESLDRRAKELSLDDLRDIEANTVFARLAHMRPAAVLKGLAEEVARLRAQRDSLLTACQRLLDCHDHGQIGDVRAAMMQVQEAVREAK